MSVEDLHFVPIQTSDEFPESDMTIASIPPDRDEPAPEEYRKFYAKLRHRVAQLANMKVPQRLKFLVPWVLALPDFLVLLFLLMKDDRVSAASKVKLAATIAYVISPLDLVPDMIPIGGQVDDVALVLPRDPGGV